MRKVHRWISLIACLFLLVVGVTGVILQVQSLTSAEEAERERLAGKPSAYALGASGPALDEARKAELKLVSLAGKALGPGASIDRIEYLLRADPARVVLHAINGGPDGSPMRFTARIADGSIIGNAGGEADPRESFILRLHTGEVLGDAGVVGGVLWGTALVGLTITGMWLYWKMYRGRAKVKGWKGILWMMAAASAVALPATRAGAGPPFLTDDPWFVDKGWEIKSRSQYERHAEAPDVLIGPTFDLNYTIVPGFKLNLTIAEETLLGKNGEPNQFGLIDTDLKFKWRFVEEEQDGWRPAISMAPTITFPTGDTGRGLSDGSYKFKVPFQFGKTFGEDHNWVAYSEIGFAKKLDGSGGSGETLIFGATLARNVTKELQVGVELYHEFALDGKGQHTQILNLGATYTFNDSWSVQFGVGKSISANDGPDPIVQLVVQWNF